METTFELNDTLYAKAEIHKTDEVNLWLGVSPPLSHPRQSNVALMQRWVWRDRRPVRALTPVLSPAI